MTHSPLKVLKRKWSLTTPFLVLLISGCDSQLDASDFEPENARPVTANEALQPEDDVEGEDIDDSAGNEDHAAPTRADDETDTSDDTGDETGTDDETETGDEDPKDNLDWSLWSIFDEMQSRDLVACSVHPPSSMYLLACVHIARDRFYIAEENFYVDANWIEEGHTSCVTGAPHRAYVEAAGRYATLNDLGSDIVAGMTIGMHYYAMADHDSPTTSHCD